VLLLFDIDGTLTESASPTHRLALLDAANTVFGRERGFVLDLDDFAAVHPDGKTDLLIVRELLQAQGLADAEISTAREALLAVALSHLEEIQVPGSIQILPTVAATLASLATQGFRMALLTGNLEPFAWAKLAAVGLDHYFEHGQGAYGSDAERRPLLGPIALTRAGVSADEAWVIGDTPGDIACAHAAGCKVIATATGRFTGDDLSAADYVVAELDGILPLLPRA
jgi:phosphoglycolate phosphatase